MVAVMTTTIEAMTIVAAAAADTERIVYSIIIKFIFFLLSGQNFRRDGRVNGRYPPPRETRHKMLVQNLSTRFSWQVWNL